MKTIKITVASKQGPYRFAVAVHALDTPDQFHMDPVEFYQQWGKAIPQGLHHELEIVEPNEQAQEALFKEHVLHTHKSRKTGKVFVSYPKQIPNIEAAVDIFAIWCLGSVATITGAGDLNTLFTGEYTNDHPKFFQMMGNRFGIEIIRSAIEE